MLNHVQSAQKKGYINLKTFTARQRQIIVRVTGCDSIIKERKVTDAPVDLTLINSTPGLFLNHMYNLLLYLDEYNHNAVMNQQEIQTEVTYSRVKNELANSTVLTKMHA